MSESFKSGSVVGKLYGASLVDIGASFALLSNLGIKGSAAGTSLKNFFSDLASGSDKVTEGLAHVGLTIKDLKDSAGNFKPLEEVLTTLSNGLNTLDNANQKLVISQISNERGSKFLVEGLSLVRKEGELTATAFGDLAKKIDESWGFAAAGAAAMSLTIDSQLKGVKNTLETQFLGAFQNIQPQISLVATRLKAAFNSQDFTSGIQQIALSVANLTVFLVENANTLKTLLVAFVAMRGASFLLGMLTGIAEGVLALKGAFDLAKISATAFQASLGFLGLALAASAALFVWWATKRDEATNSAKSQASLAYMDDFIGKLDEESDRLRKQISLMKEGKTAREADTQSMMEQQLQKVRQSGDDAVAEKVREVVRLKEGLSASELRSIDRAHSLNALSINGLTTVNAVLKAERDVATTIATSDRKSVV